MVTEFIETYMLQTFPGQGALAGTSPTGGTGWGGTSQDGPLELVGPLVHPCLLILPVYSYIC